MESGPPPKRTRIDTGSWSNGAGQPHRPPPVLPLPHGQTLQQAPQPYPPRTPFAAPPHLDDRRHHDPENIHRAPPPPPSFTSYNSREPVVKIDPSAESPHHHRPHSTGNISENYARPPHSEESRRHMMPPYEGVAATQPPPQSYQPAPPYPPPQNSYHDRSPFEGPPQTPGVYRDHLIAELSHAAMTNDRRKKAPRTSQACDACRAAKARCNESKPCSSCIEKKIECKYEPPVPKQADKLQSEILTQLNTLVRGQEHAAFEGKQLKTALLKVVPGLEEELSMQAKHHFVKEEIDYETMQSVATLTSGPSAHVEVPMDTFAPLGSPDADESQETEDDEEEGKPLPPGEPAIPVGHTTGAAGLLQWPAISKIIGNYLEDKIQNQKWPMIQEKKRGMLRIFGRGEGRGRGAGRRTPSTYDRDVSQEQGSENTPDDAESDTSNSPAADYVWGQGSLSPSAGDVSVKRVTDEQRGGLGSDFRLELDWETIKRLKDSYVTNINVMHPILVPKDLDSMVRKFHRTLPEYGHPHKIGAKMFVGGSDPLGPKRKRSPGVGDSLEPQLSLKIGEPESSIRTALILCVLALGKICEHTGRIPDCLPDKPPQVTSSPYGRTEYSSPILASPIMSSQYSDLSSPQDTGKLKQSGRRLSTDGNAVLPKQHIMTFKNYDVIPGLAYFAVATNIIGNQMAGDTLEHVHVNILAGLYHGQLGRVLESRAYIYKACCILQDILQDKLERWQQHAPPSKIPVPAKDNPYIFAFWTCLQLESDIVAELPCRHSGILTLENQIPWPNLDAARQYNHLTVTEVESYQSQLFLRNHLNFIHKTLYPPTLVEGTHPHSQALNIVLSAMITPEQIAQEMCWKDGDPPATNILAARLRAKYYGAMNITYRPFLKKILNRSPALPHGPRERDIEMAVKCIRALEFSTAAFHGMKESSRLMITNPWGTAHAQWGNVLCLQAALRDPHLGGYVDREKLKTLSKKTIDFLANVAQPSSALYTDLRILQYSTEKVGLLSPSETSTSFTTNSGEPTPR